MMIVEVPWSVEVHVSVAGGHGHIDKDDVELGWQLVWTKHRVSVQEPTVEYLTSQLHAAVLNVDMAPRAELGLWLVMALDI